MLLEIGYSAESLQYADFAGFIHNLIVSESTNIATRYELGMFIVGNGLAINADGLLSATFSDKYFAEKVSTVTKNIAGRLGNTRLTQNQSPKWYANKVNNGLKEIETKICKCWDGSEFVVDIYADCSKVCAENTKRYITTTSKLGIFIVGDGLTVTPEGLLSATLTHKYLAEKVNEAKQRIGERL